MKSTIKPIMAMALHGVIAAAAVAFIGATLFPQADNHHIFLYANFFGALASGFEGAQQRAQQGNHALAGRFVAVAAGACALAIIAAGVSCAALGRCL